jgi:peptidoglycan/xylan/chitin deacetylase (PgdA/CDA1 family)
MTYEFANNYYHHIIKSFTMNIVTAYKTHRFIILFCLLASTAFSQSHNDIAYIAKFKGDRAAAVCYSFDDGIKDQYDITYPMFKKFGFPATFFVIPSQLVNDYASRPANGKYDNRMDWSQLRMMAANGMEIANHSWTHSKQLTKLNDQQLAEEINKADSAITANIGKRPLTFAYPWNAFDAHTQSAVLKNHIASREFQFGIGSRFTTEMGNKWIDGLIQKKEWGITMAHAMIKGFDTLKSPAVLEEHLRYVKQHEDQVWVTTFEHLTQYRVERDSSTLTTIQKHNQITIKINNPLPQTLYNYPLTLVVTIPSTANSIKATQGNKQLVVDRKAEKAMIDVLPDGQAINIDWK